MRRSGEQFVVSGETDEAGRAALAVGFRSPLRERGVSGDWPPVAKGSKSNPPRPPFAKRGNSQWTAVLSCLVLLIFFLGPLSAAADLRISTTSGNLLLDQRHGGDGSAWGKPVCQGCHVLSNIHKGAPSIRGIVRTHGYGTCAGCHGSNGTNLARTCTSCHNGHDLPAAPLQSGRNKHDFTVAQVRGLGDAYCLACHLKSDMDGIFEPEVDLTPIRDAHGELSPYESTTDFCLRCHNRDHQPKGVRIKARKKIGGNDPLVAIEDDYTRIDRHGEPVGLIGPYSGLRDSGYAYGDVVECTDCHAMHGTRNGKLILDDTRKGATGLSNDFRNRPYRALVKKGNYAQFCVLCHRMDDPGIEQGGLNTGNGLSGVHDAASDCTACHTHGEPVKGGL